MSLSKRARQFQALLDERGFDCEVQELPASTRSANDAASALGCRKAQIVKSLVFCNTRTGEAVIVLASGENRVDETVMATHIGNAIDKPDAAFVKEATGFSIGGVPPLGHRQSITVWVDRDLLAYDTLWAAAGTPHAVFQIKRPITALLDDYRVVNVN